MSSPRFIVELTARIHIEEGTCWADVPELPGCFASGDTLEELFESLKEGIALHLADEPASGLRIERRAVGGTLAPVSDPS
ncbi:MAG TPA: type II toxin-antitoxin system HicB family antitoxin [Solirubrobacterales bacterium]|jgi:predicted RNase H-like HicB family nuclease